MTLQMTTQDRDLLLRLVEEHSRSLLFEIARADARHFKDVLHAELDRTDALRARLFRAHEEDLVELQGP